MNDFFVRLRIEVESAVRMILLAIEYFVWLIFYPGKFVNKPKKIRKVLVVDFGGFGDCLNTLCIIEKLKKTCEFHYLTKIEFGKLIENFPGIEIKFYDKNKIDYKEFKRESYDCAIIIHPGAVELKRLKFIKYSVGNEVEGIKSAVFLRNFFLARRIFPFYKHKIRERFKIFEKAGFKFENYMLHLPEMKEYREECRRIMKKLRIRKDEKIVIFNPSAGTSAIARKRGKIPSHDLASRKFSELANMILTEKKARIIITGTKEDKFLSDEIISGIKDKKRAISVAGETSFLGLGEFMRDLNKNGVLISVDTGTVHLGTAVGIKVIDLMGPYDPKLYCAWSPSNSLEKSRAISIFHNVGDAKSRKHYQIGNISSMDAIETEEIYEVFSLMNGS